MRIINKHSLKLIVFMLVFQFAINSAVFAHSVYPSNLSYVPPEKSREELYQDIFVSLLMPYIQKEVDKYYSKYLVYTPTVAQYSVFVLSAERPNGYRSFPINVKIKVNSYTGPHIDIGLDYITFTVGVTGDVKIKKFEHIKSYKLPPTHENIIKKGYNNPIP